MSRGTVVMLCPRCSVKLTKRGGVWRCPCCRHEPTKGELQNDCPEDPQELFLGIDGGAA